MNYTPLQHFDIIASIANSRRYDEDHASDLLKTIFRVESYAFRFSALLILRLVGGNRARERG